MPSNKSMPPLVVSVSKVWDKSPHSAFTDLLFTSGKFYLAFREADKHEKGGNGSIRILTSEDGAAWESKAVLELEDVDLRDPHLSLMPNGKIFLLCGGTVWSPDGEQLYTQPRVAIGNLDCEFTPFTTILEKNNWLWQLTWHQGKGYGVSYYCAKGEEWRISLWTTENGIDFDLITLLELDQYPNETTVKFLNDGTLTLISRRNESIYTHAVMGSAKPPFLDWEWKDLGYPIASPNFIVFSDNEMWISGRIYYPTPYSFTSKTVLFRNVEDHIKRELILPSFGDCGYPGMVFHDGFLWISYYSQHDGKCEIYLAKIMLPF